MLIFVKNDFLSPTLRKLLGTATETKNSATGMCGSKEQKRKRKKMVGGGERKGVGGSGEGRGRVLERNELRNGLLVHLEDVNDHTASGGKLLMTNMTLEMLGLLVLYQNLLILKLALAVKAPHHVRLLLLLPHR
jgi:hypothetical protein